MASAGVSAFELACVSLSTPRDSFEIRCSLKSVIDFALPVFQEHRLQFSEFHRPASSRSGVCFGASGSVNAANRARAL